MLKMCLLYNLDLSFLSKTKQIFKMTILRIEQ